MKKKTQKGRLIKQKFAEYKSPEEIESRNKTSERLIKEDKIIDTSKLTGKAKEVNEYLSNDENFINNALELNNYDWGIPADVEEQLYDLDGNDKTLYEELLWLRYYERDILKQIKIEENRIKYIESESEHVDFLEEAARYSVLYCCKIALMKVKKLIELYEERIKSFIKFNDEDDIKNIQTGANTRAKHRIGCKLKQTELIEFLELLYKYDIITKETYKFIPATIRDCFTDENGKEYDNQNISKTRTQLGIDQSFKAQKLERIIKQIDKKKQ